VPTIAAGARRQRAKFIDILGYGLRGTSGQDCVGLAEITGRLAGRPQAAQERPRRADGSSLTAPPIECTSDSGHDSAWLPSRAARSVNRRRCRSGIGGRGRGGSGAIAKRIGLAQVIARAR